MKCVADAWAAHEAELRHFVEARLGDGSEARDLVQEVFAKALQQPNGLCGIDNPRAWLFRVTRNLLADRYRRLRQALPLADDLAAEPTEALAPVDALAQCLPRVLAELSPADREAIRCCDIEGLSRQDYAARSGISLAAAKARLVRARKHLRERLVSGCQVRFDEFGKVCCFAPRSPLGE